ncbi:MAG: hypothetical protein KatS3mg009_1987 [Acidimicrobiia bacterium]|nr:MAG: hypothetical protein KatS3mg009_1987 [Acidimicrobiia bacterium]
MAHLALFRAGFRRWSSYRAAALAGVFTNTVFGFIRAGVLGAAVDAAGPIAGYDRAAALTAALTYVWLAQGLIAASRSAPRGRTPRAARGPPGPDPARPARPGAARSRHTRPLPSIAWPGPSHRRSGG